MPYIVRKMVQERINENLQEREIKAEMQKMAEDELFAQIAMENQCSYLVIQPFPASLTVNSGEKKWLEEGQM